HRTPSFDPAGGDDMSTALDGFERQLVSASRALHTAAELADGPASKNGSVRRRRTLLRRIRQLGLGLQLGLAVTSLGGGVAGFFLLSRNDVTRTVASFDCQADRSLADSIIGAVTGDPAVDCAVAWPSASGGRTTAPPLAVWGPSSGSYVAIVRPAKWGAPGSDWHRLPAGWTADLRIVVLTDQLGDISLNPDGTGISIGRCTTRTDAVRAVRELLNADGMRSWRVVVRSSSHRASVGGCASYLPDVLADARTVELTPGRSGGLPPTDAVAMRKLRALYARVDRVLRSRCDTVSAAAALWTREARAAGFAPATLAFWRAANAGNVPTAALKLPYHYTLYKQPPSQRTGTCAHMLVIVEGGGPVEAYAARITP
ncbi:MAG TPA: hypothetical protein VIX82_17710, partial [Solirubrobacteraceae bacterium]